MLSPYDITEFSKGDSDELVSSPVIETYVLE